MMRPDFNGKCPVQTIVRNIHGRVDLLRLDTIHPVVSGNKWFKLKEHILQIQQRSPIGVLTYGGAWSNHLVAVAYAAQTLGLPSVGMVRGDEKERERLTAGLNDCLQYGMKLEFRSRKEYGRKNEASEEIWLKDRFPGWYVIPEGAADAVGVSGAASIPSTVEDFQQYTHIACAVGTGAMMAGLARAAHPRQTVIGFSSFSKNHEQEALLNRFLPKEKKSFYSFNTEYAFGGYAGINPDLVRFMNEFYQKTGIPTDRVYSAKMIFGVLDLFQKNYFPPESRILAIHCGGLQGNRSLPTGSLLF